MLVEIEPGAIVELLLEAGASPTVRNARRESVIDVVSGPWSAELAGFYSAISDGAGLDLDLEQIQELRPKIAKMLKDAATD